MKQRGDKRKSVRENDKPYSILPTSYADLLTDLKSRIAQERVRVVMAANVARAMVQEALAQIPLS